MMLTKEKAVDIFVPVLVRVGEHAMITIISPSPAKLLRERAKIEMELSQFHAEKMGEVANKMAQNPRKEPEEGEEISKLKNALDLVKEAKSLTRCATCKEELSELEKDFVEHVGNMTYTEAGKEILRRRFPGKKWDDLTPSEKDEVKSLRERLMSPT